MISLTMKDRLARTSLQRVAELDSPAPAPLSKPGIEMEIEIKNANRKPIIEESETKLKAIMN